VRAWREDTHIQVSITDSGPGIKPEDQARLFEPFQQLDTSIRRRHGGSGLGVNISKHFVEMHGGRIWMESQLGVGTTFVVSLPIALPDPGGGDGGSARRWINPYQEYVPRTRLRVAPVPEMSARYIVLEQGQVLSRLLRRYLQDAEVVSATTWQTALELAAESPPTAFLVNTAAQPTMPWAHDAAGDVAQNGVPFDTPLFACWLPDDASRQLGVQRYLVKPVSGLALFDAVRDVCPTARTILIADDEPDLLRMFRRVLAAAEGEYRVMTAESGVDALALLRETAPDLLILDLIMPGMTGFDLLKEKAQDPALAQIPVIVISSRDPNQQPIVSTQLLVARGGGLSARTLLDCVQALTGLLAPTSRPLRPAPPGVEGA
jgi:CheY-like chemotaxis protein